MNPSAAIGTHLWFLKGRGSYCQAEPCFTAAITALPWPLCITLPDMQPMARGANNLKSRYLGVLKLQVGPSIPEGQSRLWAALRQDTCKIPKRHFLKCLCPVLQAPHQHCRAFGHRMVLFVGNQQALCSSVVLALLQARGRHGVWCTATACSLLKAWSRTQNIRDET